MSTPDANFEYALTHTLEAEGGALITNYAWDPGGKTKYGITQATWKEFQKRSPKHRGIALEDISKAHATDCYYAMFWVIPGFLDVQDKFIAAELFDTGVNCGTARAIRMFQEAINFLRLPGQSPIAVDGNLGPVTRGTAHRLVKNGYRLNLLRAMNGEQYIHYKAIGNQHAARGWTRRLAVALEAEQ